MMDRSTSPFISLVKDRLSWQVILLSGALALGGTSQAQTNALSFDGVNDRVDCGSDASIDITGTGLTMEAWIYPTSWKTNTYQGDIINKESSSGGGVYTLRCGAGGKLNANIHLGADIETPTPVLTLNTWQHVACTYDGAMVHFYVNGVDVYSVARTGSMIASPGIPLCIGNSFNYPDRGFPGKIDEVRIWNIPKSGAAILAHMDTAYCGTETGLVAYYRFDQGTADAANPTETTLTDLTGYANNGTLTNFALTGTTSNWVDGVTGIADCVPVLCPSPIAVAITNATFTGFDLSWTDNGATGYEYEVRTSGDPGSGATGLSASGSAASGNPAIPITGLAANMTYYAYVRADCAGGLFSDWSYPVSLHIGYCVPVGTSTTYYINNFITTGGDLNINNSGSGLSTGGYGDFSTMVVSDYAGESFDFTANYSGGTFHTRIWVDWNNDFVFDDVSELVFNNITSYQSTATGTITIPAGTPIGSYRMRIRQGYIGTPASCGNSTYGEAEDYTITVTPPPTCVHPTALVTTATTSSSVDFSWTASVSAPANGYQWEVRTNGDPGSGTTGLAASGTTAAGVTNDMATGLSANTNYFIYVRGDCGSGDLSSWTSATSFTTPCVAVDIPYYEDFSSVTIPAIPNCMSIQTVSGNPWTTATTTLAGMTSPSARVTYTFFGNPPMDSWLYTAGLNLLGGVSYQLTYKYGNTSTFYTESMAVSYGTGASEADMVNPLADHPSVNGNILHIDTINFTPAADGVYYIGFKCNSIADQLYLFLDDIKVIVTPSCYSPVASAWIAPDCDNSQYYVHVDLSDLGTATSVDIMSDYAGNPGGVTAVDSTGDFILGPFASLDTVNISVVHNEDDSCSIALDPITYDCSDDGQNALSFDGVDDRVNCGSNPSVAITGNAVTLEAWIYPTAWKTNTYQGNIVNSEGGNTGYMLRCGDNGKLDFNLGDGAGWHQMISPANTLTLNTWQYVAGTYDGDSMRMYVNGVQVMALHGVFNIGATGTPLVIGDWSNGTGRNFPGKIDEVRVWNTAVSAANIVAHMNTAYCGNETGLVAYYKFDQGIANGANPVETTLNDLTGYANNGTLTGFALNGATSNWVVGVLGIGDCVPVACPSPIAATITNVTDNGFDIAWTDNGAASYEYEVRSSGAPGSGTTGLEASGTATSGATPITISGLGIDTTYYVYVRASCTGGVFSDWSSPTNIHLGYCLPVGTSTTYYINNFVTTGGSTNITNTGSGLSTGGYGNFSTMAVSTYAGESFNFTANYSGGTFHTRIWVDWNNDFDFDDAGELVFDGTTYVSTATGSITIPAGTPEGSYRMRIRQGYIGTPTPCGNSTYGEAEDYTITVTAPPTCVHPTNIVTTAASSTSVDFSWTASVTPPANGYQWEVRSSGVPGSGATGLAANGATAAGVTNDQATGLTANTNYSIYVRGICNAGDTSSWAGPLAVYTGYCSSNFTSTSFEYLANVTFGEINNTTTGITGGPVDYTSQVANVLQGSSHTISVTIQAAGTEYVYAFFDWNHDLVLNDPGEEYTVANGVTNVGPYTLNIDIPANAAIGNTRMRVMLVYGNATPDPCIIATYGEAEDYTVNVISLTPCSGMPAPGATTGLGTACLDEPFTLSVANDTAQTGLTYQWQVSSDGTTWTNAPGASTSVTYTTTQAVDTWYQLQVTCEFGSTATSTPLQVTMAPPNQCYCTGYDISGTVEPICNVTFADIDHDSPSTINGSPALENFTATIGHVDPGTAYTISVTGNTNGNGTNYIAAFFDWNGDGAFETVEPVGSISNNVCTTPATHSITVPANAIPGNTRMRVVMNYNASPSDPCAAYVSGQAEDYTINVSQVDCEGVAGGPALPGTACYNTSNGWGGIWSNDCVCIPNVGVGEIAGANGFAIYPNPASTILYITTANDRPVHVKVYDMVGTLVMEKDMVHQLDITKLATGSYTLVATDAKGGNEVHARFMKQ